MRKFTVIVLMVLWSSVACGAEIIAAEQPFFDTSGAVAGRQGNQGMVAAAEPIARLAEDDKTLYSVRCWQKGQLIIDETDWSAPQLSAEFVALRKVGTPSPGMFLLNFEETFCELKEQSPQLEPAPQGGK